MPELPDVTIYVERLRALCTDRPLRDLRIGNPFVLRTVDPEPAAAIGRAVTSVERVNKRIVLGFDTDLFFVIHLMIAGRLRMKKPGATLPKGNGLLALDFDHGTLLFTEAGKKRRASLHVVASQDAVAQFDRGGLEVLGADFTAFATAMRKENHTIKRALTDQSILSGIGNAYSDEILHRARMSPFLQTAKMDDAALETLFDAIREVLDEWTCHLREEVADGFPDKVTAFREGMAVHGRFGEPCPVCDAPVQRIRYADNEANYCARCQTDGRMLADRSLSRLLKSSWPKRIEDL